jgi:hypothetical protein
MSIQRREFISAFATTIALSSILQTKALASPPRDLNFWAQGIADLNRDLSTGKIGLTDWQDRIALLHTGVDFNDLRKYLDFDRLTAAMKFPSKLADTADPKFPDTINVGGIERPWFIRFFGMRKGGAVIPHVHNNMASAHLVIEGTFHARTFDRIADLAAAVVLKPVRDEIIKPGASVTMSDDRENSHWLVAQQDRSFTFDVGILELSKTRTYGLKANRYSMIFVDPTGTQDSAGKVTAPVLTFEECVAKFAA